MILRLLYLYMMITKSEVDRSLPLVVYTPQGGTKKSALKGFLPPACRDDKTFITVTPALSLSLPRRRESRIFNVKIVYSHIFLLFSLIPAYKITPSGKV